MVIIQTDDEQKSHDVERNLIRYLKTYDDMLNCIEDNNTIQLSMVQYPIFLKMIEYTKLLINNNEQKDKDTFLENVHNIKELIIMADFANFEQLLEDLQVYLIKKIKKNSINGIRKILDIQDEDIKVRNDNYNELKQIDNNLNIFEK